MSKTETLRQSAQASNETRLQHLASQVQAQAQAISQARHQSVDDLASMLEPLAQALAALTDQAGKTLTEIDHKNRETSETFQRQLDSATRSLKDAAAQAQSQAKSAADNLSRAGNRLGWKHYSLATATAVATGAITAMLVSAFWLWAYPPTLHNTLDPKAVANLLKPAVIEALKPSRGK
jgi:DNA repair exonuclease SbcCD ATPase subunit